MLKRKMRVDAASKQQKPAILEGRIVGKTVQKELMVLQMVPTIIRKLKAHKLSAFETSVLCNRFGDLWHLIVDEAKRSPSDEMNPILSTLLNAQKMPFDEAESNSFNNDVQSDSIKQIGRRQRSHSGIRMPFRMANLRMKENLTPAQRLLKVAAILIHESLSKKINEGTQTARRETGAPRNTRRHQNRIHKKQLHHPKRKDLIALKTKFNNQPEAILNAVRHKRSLKYIDSSKNDEVAMNLLRTMIEPNEAKEDDVEEMDDDYNFDEIETANTNGKGKDDDKVNDAPTDQKKQTQQLKREQQAKQVDFIKGDDYKDYAFDTADTDHFDEDEDLLRSFYGHRRQSVYEDYDYGSFSDLIHLAAKHTLRTQREDKYLSRLHFDDYLNDDPNDYNDEDYDV